MTQLPPPPHGTVQIVIKGDIQGLTYVNVFWASSVTTADPTRAQMDSLATALLNTYQLEFRPMMQNGVNINECDATFFVSSSSVIPGTAVSSLAGTRAGTALTAQVCGVVNWHTNFDHYRGGHSRTYIPGPVTADLANQHSFLSAYTSALATHAGSWRTAINAYAAAPFTSLTHSMLNRIRDKQPLAVPELHPITGQTVRVVCGTQRRRLT